MDNRKIIYLDDAIDAVQKLTYADGAYGYADAKDLVDSLKNLPSAQPERLRLDRILKKASIHRYGNDVCCSNLDHALDRTFGYKFCPMCGASLMLRIEKQKGRKNEL